MTRQISATWQLSGFGDEIDPDPAVQVAVLQALGANHIEVRSAWNTNIVELTASQLDELAKVFTERGIGVSAIASPVGKVNIDSDDGAEFERLKRAIAAAHRLDARYIRIFSFYRAPSVTAGAIRDDVLRRLAGFADLARANDV